MTTKPPSRIDYRQGKARAQRNRITSSDYVGPFGHLTGDRQGENPVRMRWMGSWVEQTPVHALVAWAADFPGRRYGKIEAKERALPLWVAMKYTGQAYSQPLPPISIGLGTNDRATLRRFLLNPTDKAAARELASWLSLRPSRSSTVTYRRYASGNVVTVMSSTTNANKSGATIVAGIGGESRWFIPSRYKGVGAATGFGRLEEKRAVATSNDGGRLELDLSRMGPIAYEVIWDKTGARLAGEQVATTGGGAGEGGQAGGGTGGAIGPMPSATLSPACAHTHRQIYKIQTAASSPRLAGLFATLGEGFRRLCVADQLDGERQRDALSWVSKAADTLSIASSPRQ